MKGIVHRRMPIYCASGDVGWLVQILLWMMRGADVEQARCAEAQSENRRSLNYSSASDGQFKCIFSRIFNSLPPIWLDFAGRVRWILQPLIFCGRGGF